MSKRPVIPVQWREKEEEEEEDEEEEEEEEEKRKRFQIRGDLEREVFLSYYHCIVLTLD
jgi:hypothetical protein